MVAGCIGIRTGRETCVQGNGNACFSEAANSGVNQSHQAAFNVSQAVFARIINVSPNAVESWEEGVRRPREATLKLLPAS